MIIELGFEFGDYAILKHDLTKTKRMVISVSKSISGGIRVELASGLDSTWHFIDEVEILKDTTNTIGFK